MCVYKTIDGYSKVDGRLQYEFVGCGGCDTSLFMAQNVFNHVM